MPYFNGYGFTDMGGVWRYAPTDRIYCDEPCAEIAIPLRPRTGVIKKDLCRQSESGFKWAPSYGGNTKCTHCGKPVDRRDPSRAIAVTFCDLVRDALTSEQLDAVRRLNKALDCLNTGQPCCTLYYCDSNALMMRAMAEHGFDGDPINPEQAYFIIWREAWTKAIKNEFVCV